MGLSGSGREGPRDRRAVGAKAVNHKKRFTAGVRGQDKACCGSRAVCAGPLRCFRPMDFAWGRVGANTGCGLVPRFCLLLVPYTLLGRARAHWRCSRSPRNSARKKMQHDSPARPRCATGRPWYSSIRPAPSLAVVASRLTPRGDGVRAGGGADPRRPRG